MTRLQSRSTKAQMASSWKSGFSGFIVCAMLVLLLCLSMYFAAGSVAAASAKQIAETFGEPESTARAALLTHLQWVTGETGKILVFVLAIYWSMSALFGRGPISSIKSANFLLLIAIGCFLAGCLNAYFGWANTVCDVLPFPHQGFQLSKIHECPSSSTFFSGLSNAFLVLIVLSLAIRIVKSRKDNKITA